VPLLKVGTKEETTESKGTTHAGNIGRGHRSLASNDSQRVITGPVFGSARPSPAPSPYSSQKRKCIGDARSMNITRAPISIERKKNQSQTSIDH
jgi:hypothetical protein